MYAFVPLTWSRRFVWEENALLSRDIRIVAPEAWNCNIMWLDWLSHVHGSVLLPGLTYCMFSSIKHLLQWYVACCWPSKARELYVWYCRCTYYTLVWEAARMSPTQLTWEHFWLRRMLEKEVQRLLVMVYGTIQEQEMNGWLHSKFMWSS